MKKLLLLIMHIHVCYWGNGILMVKMLLKIIIRLLHIFKMPLFVVMMRGNITWDIVMPMDMG